MTKLPQGWRWEQLGDVSRLISGGTPYRGNKEYFYGNIPWVKTTDLNIGYITSTEEYISETAFNDIRAEMLPVGTVMVAMYGGGGTIGKSGILAISATTNQSICSILPNPSIFVPEFLHCYLRLIRPSWMKYSGGNRKDPNINKNIVSHMKIPLPPLAEQRRIVASLDEKLAAIDRARAAAAAQLEAARALSAAYLREVFGGKVAAGWARKKLGEILFQRREVIHPRDNPSGPATFVGLEHIESGTGRRIGAEPVEMSELTGRKPKYYQGDIVYGYLRPYLNKVWLAEFEGLCSVDQYVYYVDPATTLAEFVAWFMRSAVYLKRAPIGLTPGQLPRIRTEEVALVEINLPSLEEQKCVVAEIRNRLDHVSKVNQSLLDQLNTINALPATLLRQAFSGEL